MVAVDKEPAKEDIRARWRFGLSEPEKSGAPGRPTSMHLVLTELQRRNAAGELRESASKEAAELAAWLAIAHPGAPSLTAKTIRNKILELFRVMKTA